MKVSGNIYRISFTLLFIICVTVVSCKKDDDGPTPDPIPPSGSTLKTNVAGKVTNTDGDVMQGVTVTLAGKTTVTDHRGLYLFKNIDVPKDRMVLKAVQTGYFDCIKGKKTQTGGVNYVDMVIQELPAAVNINATSGGTVNIPGGARIVFQPGSFVDQNGNPYTGTVKVYARHFNPAAPGFAAIVPGGDLIGKNILGENVALYPMGMIEALLRDQSGVNEIKIASGSTAQLRVPIDPSQNAMAQSTVPLWHLNETTGIWKEEGEAVKNGNFFEGNVSHFSVWNCDYQGERTTIIGKVLDCQNLPVPGVVVTINSFMNLSTNNAGEYTTWVPAGFVITAQVLAINNPIYSFNSTQQVITANNTPVNMIPDILMPCSSRIKGETFICQTNLRAPAFIYCSSSLNTSFFYAPDGKFNFPASSDTDYSLDIFSGSLKHQLVVSTIGLGQVSDIGSIHVCDTITIPANQFTVNFAGGNIQTYSVSIIPDSVYYQSGDIDGDGQIDQISVSFSGYTQFNELVQAYIGIEMFESNLEYSLGSMGIGSFMSISIGNQPPVLWLGSGAWGGVYQTDNKIRIRDFGQPGGFLIFDFEFDSYQNNIVYNGSFAILRPN
jgi:hypothetical protein